MARKNPETVVVSGFSEPISFSVRNVGCGGRTRTYDLRVMSPTSFQLLYSAIWVRSAECLDIIAHPAPFVNCYFLPPFVEKARLSRAFTLSLDKVLLIPHQEGVNGPYLPPQIGITSNVFIENGIDLVHMEELLRNLAVELGTDIAVIPLIRHPNTNGHHKTQLFPEAGWAGYRQYAVRG